MTAPRRTPPGRAGRLRLRHGLEVAERGADLLEQKLRVLRAEHRRLVGAERAAALAWRERLAEAESWLLRGVLLSGERALDALTGTGSAEVTIDWVSPMGVRHPAQGTCTFPARPLTAAAPRNTALVHAEAAYREAVRAALDHAVARSAARTVGAEVLSTRQRVRALRRHWIPRLREALVRAELALEQSEHEDAVRRRWAAGAPARDGRPSAG